MARSLFIVYKRPSGSAKLGTPPRIDVLTATQWPFYVKILPGNVDKLTTYHFNTLTNIDPCTI
jgi:hypothetical protein